MTETAVAQLYVSKSFGFIDAACQYTEGDEEVVALWCGGRPYRPVLFVPPFKGEPQIILNVQGVGKMIAYIGDWIIETGKKNFFVLPPSTFKAMYTPLEDIV